MRPKFTLVFILFLLGCSFVKAQNCDPLSPPDEAAAGCACAYPDCDVGLNGFTGLLGDPNGFVTPIPECTDGNGGSFHNDDWIAFIAGTSSISITITPTNCDVVGGLTGVQAGFYEMCDDSGVQEGVPSGGLLVQCACSDQPLTLDYDGFVCGQTYYIFLDGCGGSVCDYTIVVNSGSTTLTEPGPLGTIVGPTDVCPGQTVTYSIDQVFCVPDYIWDVTGGGTILETDGNTVTVQWNSAGSISVFGENACFMTNNSGPLNVNVTPLDDVNYEGSYCQGDPQGFFWPVTNQTYFAGQYQVDLVVNGGPNDGCLQTNILNVTEDPSYDITVNRTICFGEQVIYGGQSWSQQGSFEIPLTTQNTGCDSIINLNLTVLDPLSFVNLQPPLDVITCTQTSVIVDGSQSFPAQDIQFYNWSSPTNGDICGGLGSPVITVCTPGTYCLEVGYGEIDGESGQMVTCTNESCIDVEENVDNPTLSIDFTNVDCGGDSTGTATVTISGGQNPFLIAWTDDNNTTTETVTDLPAGTYTVSVFSLGNGCTSSETITILEPDPILLDISSTSTICSGEASGSATVVASGGAGGFMYEWDDPGNQTTATATGLGTGTYTVVVTDVNGCTMENTVSVVDALPMSVSIDGVDILCNGGTTGSATATGSGGTGVYTYEWDDANGQVTQTAVDLPAGDYNVIITDENGCTATNSVTLQESNAIELTTGSTQTSCLGSSDGSATVSTTGGVGPYSYEWDDPGNQITATASDIPAGTYTVVVTDVNGCTGEATVDVDEPSGVTVTTDFVDTQCNGSLDGEASVDAMGGTPPLTYQWDDPNNQTNAIATGLGAGTYTVVITDANDCTITETIIVSEPTAIELTESGVNPLCDGSTNGEASVSTTGGTPPYEYAWDDPNGQSTATATNLEAGTYTVVVTDANDCTETVSVTITEPTALELTESGTDALCSGSLDGEVSVVVTGGTAPYEYEWDDPNAQNTATAIDLGAGTYTVIVTDANDCTGTVSMTILEPSELEITTNGTDPDCFNSGDGSVSVSATGGTAPYEYEWDDPNGQDTPTATGLDAGTFTVIVTDANGCSTSESIDLTAPPAINLDTDQVNILCTTETTGEATVIATGGTPPLSYEWDDNASQNTATASGLGVGTYNVIVTDNNGCSETISVTLTEPAEVLSASGTSTDALCGQNDGTIDVTVTGGTAPYNYDWNGSAPDIQDPTNLGPGSYSVVITDANGCTTTITVVVASPDSPSASVAITDVNCNGEQNGAMDITVSGGISPYTYVWDTPNNGDEDLLDVGAGSYSVTVTDQVGCTTVANGVIPEPDLMEATATPSPADCGIDNGSISVVVSGGVGVYDFDWPGTGQDGTQSPTGLAPGSYEVTITDENGCTVTAAADVVVPNGPSTSLVSTDAGCNGDSTGTVSLTITGGTGPYDIDWGNPNLNGNENLTDLPAGTYDVIITDANNCSATGTIDVLEPELLEATVTTTPLTCNGSNDGTSTVTPTGGTPPYSYTWCDGQTTQTAISCPAGDCVVVVTDANGCTVELTATVDEPAALVADAIAVDADCNAATTGSIDVTVSGGTAPYNYTWTGGIPDTQDPVDIGADSYDVVITDANGCSIEITAIQVNEPDAISISSITTDATCNQSNGTIDLTVTGGTAPYTYAWTGGLPPDEDPQAAATGSYDVVVTDANGCTALHTTLVNTPDQLGISAIPTAALCNSSATGSIDVTVTGGTPPFTYQWDDPAAQTIEDAIGLPAGDYTLIVTDDNGCTISVSALVDEPTPIELSSVSIPTLCFGSLDGSIDLTVTGGTPPYSYQWDDVNAQNTEDAIGLGSAGYSVIVTDANGCTAELSDMVDSPTELSTSTTSTDALCFSSSTGAIDLTVSGGTAPYTYQWNDANAQITEDAVDLASGNYDVVVTDANGCTILASAIVDEPSELEVNGTTAQATCSEPNGSIDLTVIGGTAPYSYAWTGGLPGDEDPQGVFSGIYDVVVTDANGCTAALTLEVTEPAALGVSTIPFDALCNAEASGSIDLTVTGGTAPYTYQWDDTNAQTIEDANNLLAGTYNVIVTDDNGCTITTSAQIGEPTAIQSSNTTTDALCGESNGTIDLTVTGGTAPYTFMWSSGDDVEDPIDLLAGSYNVTITDNNGCELEETVVVSTPNQLEASAETFDALCFGSSTGSIDATITGGTAPYDIIWGGLGSGEDQTDVPAGDYIGIVTDADGCQVVVAASVDEPEELVLNGTSIQATCNQANGTIDLTVTGGTAPYSYAWSNGSMIEDPQGVAAGSYDVVVTDANGCSATYTQDVSTPSALGTSTESEDALCNGSEDGEVDLTVTGGTAPYTYAWNNTATTEDLIGVGAGTYIVTVTDGDGCTITASATIDHPDVLVAVNNAPSDVSCNGGNDGSATIVVNGGTPGYSFDWSDNTYDGQNAPNNLVAGSYTVTVTDANGCTATEQIDISEPDVIVLDVSSIAAFCNGASDGSIDLTVAGGTSPFTYDWNNGTYQDQDPQGVTAGNYTVIVTDANGCTETTSIFVDQPAAILVNIGNLSNYGGVNVSCANSLDGSAEASANGGTAPYTFEWNTGVTTSMIDNIGPGSYQVTVTDVNGCTSESQVSLSSPPALDITADVTDPTCFEENDGVILVEGIGGTAPYLYSLDGETFSGLNIFGGLTAGSYTVTVQDVNGCEELIDASVVDPQELIVDLGDDIVIQMGDSVQLEPIANIPQFALDTFTWARTEITDYNPWVGPLQTQTYYITVVNESGCIAEDEIVVRVRKDRLIYIPNAFTPNDDGFNDLFMIHGGQGVKEVKTFRIFNRWGEIIYEGLNFQPNDPDFGWNGKFKEERLNPAVFVYLAEVEFIDGRVEIYKGDVTLMR